MRSPGELRVVRPLASLPEVVGSTEVEPATEWLHKAQAGDQDAFRKLIEGFQDRVFRVVMNILRCDRATGEDLCQEVFMRVYRALDSFDGSSRVGAWIHTIATNVAISEYRKRRAKKRGRPTWSLDAPIDGTDDQTIDPVGRERDPADISHQKEFVEQVRRCVQELPDEFREAVVLRDMEGLSYEEIAEALGLAPGTVRSRIHRGRLALKEMLGEFRP
ncbi:MAG: sigma-70 family RNA polymerase sigma factor [Planctomycetota bacterium]|nr:sigma-70 family RNA polymerase sigma factor [Planctomycetota bacterium]